MNEDLNDVVKDIRVVLMRTSSGWICQCLEFDICSRGDTKLYSLDLFKNIYRNELEDKKFNLSSIRHTVPNVYEKIYRKTDFFRPDGNDTIKINKDLEINMEIYVASVYIVPYIEKRL